MNTKPRVLLVGESWMSLGTHIKGFNEFPTAFYEVGHRALSYALQEQFEIEHLPSHRAATEFPEDVEQLSQYAVILFSDIGSDTFLLHPDTFLRYIPRRNRLQTVRDYVAKGGGFGMIGGYMSFGGFGGKAHFCGTVIEEILPVKILPYDDRIEVPEGFSPTVSLPDHPIVGGLVGEWPILLGYNKLSAKADSEVILKREEDVILAVQEYEQGRTLAFASDCAPHWGSVAFTEWESYPAFWNTAIMWLAKQA